MPQKIIEFNIVFAFLEKKLLDLEKNLMHEYFWKRSNENNNKNKAFFRTFQHCSRFKTLTEWYFPKDVELETDNY